MAIEDEETPGCPICGESTDLLAACAICRRAICEDCIDQYGDDARLRCPPLSGCEEAARS